jgi:glycosyltransferase involved in cell wall biosynthesis
VKKMTTLADRVPTPQKGPNTANALEGVSVVIPAYNEETGIGPVLTQLSHVLADNGLAHEIIVVDDASQDKTAATAEQCAGVKVLRHKDNRGYGAALKTGLRHAHYDLICITDADGTYPIERIPDLVKRLLEGGYDMVVGARTGEDVAIPLIRRPAKWALEKLANLIVGEPIPDINSGFRVCERSIMLRFFNLLPDSFSFTTTITLGMLTNGYLVDYLPINYHVRVGRSKIRPIRDTISFTQLILSIALYFAPLKIFLPLSGLLFLVALAWGLLSATLLGRLADVSTLIIAMTAVQVAVVGLLAELINRRLPNFHRKNEEPDDRVT